jgi:hypothetical protein
MPCGSGTSSVTKRALAVAKEIRVDVPNDANNVRLRELIAAAAISQREARERFNEGLLKGYSESAWKAFLADPLSVRWRRLGDKLLAHAEKVLVFPTNTVPGQCPGNQEKNHGNS